MREKDSLIIISGYLRYFSLGLEGIRRQVLAANPHVQFDVAVFTSTRVLCTDRDRFYGECPCFEHIPRNLTHFVNAVLSGPELGQNRAELVHVVHSPTYYQRHEGGIGARFPTRLTQAFDTLGREALALYQRILIIRPDVVLAQPINLHRLCRASRGIHIIGGIEKRPMVRSVSPLAVRSRAAAYSNLRSLDA